MASGFKNRLKRLHDSRKRLSQVPRNDESPRVYYADQEQMAADKPPQILRDLGQGAKSKSSWGAQLLGGVHECLTARGTAHYLLKTHLATSSHGRWTLRESLAVQEAEFSAFFPTGPSSLKVTDLAFVDLETTGLSKKSYPFCVGVGLWEDGKFAVYHYLMRDETDEAAVLEASVAAINSAQGVCTFNGTSFDIPMLRRRCEYHGIEHRFEQMPHWDLLVGARKVFPGRKSHKLSLLERDILDFRRGEDIPGAQIPARWQRYLKHGQPEILSDIFEHNRLDILSLVGLCAALSAEISQIHGQNSQRASDNKTGKAVAKSTAPTSVASSLARSYRLRRKSNAETGPDAEPSGLSKSPERRRANIGPERQTQTQSPGERLGHLRQTLDAFDGVLSQSELSGPPGDELIAVLHEMLALSPRHPIALEQITDLYRRRGQRALAEHFAARLRDVSPF